MDVALISVDSTMVYRGLDIGTAKPDKPTLDAYPHALIDIKEPEDSFSVQTFCEMADATVERALADGKLPLLVGGSMMYFRAFRTGLAQLPSANADVRREIRLMAESSGLSAVHAELQRVDPESARAIDHRNLKRMERALEIYRLTGKPMTALWQERAIPSVQERLNCELVEFVMPPIPRLELHQRIETRLRAMFQQGFVDEVVALQRRPGLTGASLSMQSVGYRQVWEHLDENDGLVDESSLFQECLVATRRLARKQLTWLRQWQDLEFTSLPSFEIMIERLKR